MSNRTTIVLTGGGSGGHITPIMAVASELKKLRPDTYIAYIGQAGDGLADIPAKHPAIDAVYQVRAGKFRRYHGEGWGQLLDIKTQALNVRDAFRVLAGTVQSYWLLRRLKPEVIFTRGGYVSVPVALGGHLLGIPYITHDSDSTPSLANRIIARWAAAHAVSLPVELYPYPAAKTVMVGVPVSGDYVPVDAYLRLQYRKELGLPEQGHVLFVTGGGNGAAGLNAVVLKSAPALLGRYPDLVVVHLAGRALEAELSKQYDALLAGETRKRVMTKGFVTDAYRYSGAADVVIARGGASGLAEFAIQGKACIIIPAKQLVWQAHHAATLARRKAILELDETQAQKTAKLTELIVDLLDNDVRRASLAANLSALARPDAAKLLAMLLLEQTRTPR